MASSATISRPRFRCFDPTNSYPGTTDHPRYFSSAVSPTSSSSSSSSSPRENGFRGTMAISDNSEPKIVTGEGGYVLEDVPHLVDYIPDLPVSLQLSFFLFCFRKTEEFVWSVCSDIFWFLIKLLLLLKHMRSSSSSSLGLQFLQVQCCGGGSFLAIVGVSQNEAFWDDCLWSQCKKLWSSFLLFRIAF